MILSRVFEAYSQKIGINFVREYKFHPTRRWRFDFADIENKIAVEIEGGVWVKGRHTRAQGYINDLVKYNQATVLGWKLLRYATEEQLVEYFEGDYKALLNYTT